MHFIHYRKFVADFETVVEEDTTKQEYTEVWKTAAIPLDAPCDPHFVTLHGDIHDFMKWIFNLPGHKKVYFHNLKFDGNFILHYLEEQKFELWAYGEGKDQRLFESNMTTMPTRTYTVMIDEMGQWFTITIKFKNKITQFTDSLKLLPFTLDNIGKSFETEFRKSSIEYKGNRYANCPTTPEEDDYIRKDVLVLHEALNKLFDMTGEERMTIGSLCMHDFSYSSFHDRKEMKAVFPDLSKVECPIQDFASVDEYCRKAYRGGWTYLKKGKENTPEKPQLIYNGCTADVNSLYPSMMHSESGNYFPYGKPKFFKGDIPEEVIEKSKNHKVYYFIRIKTRFYLKKDHLPCIQIKGNPLYPPRTWLETSDVNGSSIYKDIDGNIQKCIVEMTLTQTDFQLIQDHYELKDLEIIDGCYFRCVKGIFDKYIDKWAKIKQENKGAIRTLAKLFLNNLYGKLSTSPRNYYKIPFIDENGILRCKLVQDKDKDASHIACGAAITSYARNFTIRHAQENYEHFIYADTDSIHCDCSPEELIDIKEHPTAFQCWKIENEWDKAVFVRSKTYIEHTIKEDREDCDPYYLIKCAGMGKGAKKEVERRLLGKPKKDEKKCTDKIKLKDFCKGLSVSGDLTATNIRGGVLLVDSEFVLR